MSLAMAKGMLPLWRGWSIFPDGGMWRRCPQLHWFRNIQSSCFEVAPVFSLWISNSFLSSFVAEDAWRHLEGIFSPKANIWAWSYPWRRGGFGNLPSCKGLVVWNPSSLGFAHSAANRSCTRVLESMVRLKSGTFPCLRAPLLCTPR